VPSATGEESDDQGHVTNPKPVKAQVLVNDASDSESVFVNAAEVAKDATGMTDWSLSLLMRCFLAELAPGWSQQGFNLGELGCGACPVLLFSFPPLVSRDLNGKSEIVLFDYNSDAVAEVNKSEDLLACTKLGWTVLAKVLDWSKPIESEYDGFFDVIIGSEILYYATDLSEILNAVKFMMKKNGVFILISSLRGTGLDDILNAAEEAKMSVAFLDIHLAKQALQSSAMVNGYNVFCEFKNMDLDHSNHNISNSQSKNLITAGQNPNMALHENFIEQWRIPNWKITEEIEDYHNENDIFAEMNVF